MKVIIHLISISYLIFFTYSLKEDTSFLYTIDYLFSYFDTIKFTEQQYQEILGNLSIIFENSYAFNDISKNPPQPSNNYHSIVDIKEQLKQIETKDIKNLYDFYSKISNILSDLKDPHIRLFFNDLYLNYFYILGPFDYVIKEYEGEQRIFAECLSNEIIKEFKFENDFSIFFFCQNNTVPIKSINGKDPFEYINNFGENFVASKNNHGTFSFKMNYNNWVPLNDYPLSQEELNYLEVIFDDEIIVKTKYLIQSQISINFGDNNLRLLDDEKVFDNKLFYKNKTIINNNVNIKEKIQKKQNLKNKNNNNVISKIKSNNLRELLEYKWDYETDEEDLFKCYADNGNKINIYYVGSFEPKDRKNYIETMLKCVELFDKNLYPIVVINEMNAGGYASLAQLFMGVLSPLIPINLFKGRLRITDSLKETDEILQYISSNLTNIHNCQKASLDELLSEKVKTNYSDTYLTGIFYINNITIHNKIEEIRKTMKNKRKPTEILILTDGYSFSTTALYIKYLQKMGGAIVAGFKGNPYDNSTFDSGQSPSMIFTSDLLNIFNKEENEMLKNNNIILEIPGIQTFYDIDDKDVPLEYEVTPVDKRIQIYKEFNLEISDFIEEIFNIFKEMKEKCYSNNIIKFTEECDINFEEHTHGGFACNNDNTWSDICVEAYCDLGYSFDKKEKKCIKDICSSIDDEDDQSKEEENKEEENNEEEENKGEEEEEKSNEGNKKEVEDDSTIFYVVIFTIIGIIVIFIVVFIVVNCNRKRLYSNSIDFSQ